jgi:hypothetical protein
MANKQTKLKAQQRAAAVTARSAALVRSANDVNYPPVDPRLVALIDELRAAEIADMVAIWPDWEPDRAWLDAFAVRGLTRMLAIRQQVIDAAVKR